MLLAIVGLLFRNDPGGAWNKITEQMSYFLDKSAVEVVQNIAQKAAQPNKSLLATIIGILLALFGASGVFGQLQDALNTIWGVRAKPGAGIWGFLRSHGSDCRKRTSIQEPCSSWRSEIHSSAVWACAILPGPNTTLGMPPLASTAASQK